MNNAVKLDRARNFHQQGRLAEAVPLYKEVLTLDPYNSEALHLLGLAMATLGHSQVAVNLFTNAAQLQPYNAEMLTNLASALSAVGRYAEALPYYDRAIDLAPKLAIAQRGRGTVQMLLGQYEVAASSFRQAVRLNPEDDHAHNGLGAALERLNRLPEACQALQRSIELNPHNPQAHHNLGLIHAALGRPAEALASLERALQLQPQVAAVHVNRGVQLLALGRHGEAIDSFAIAVRFGDHTPIPHHNTGLALFNLARYNEALESFDKALALDPASAATLLWRAKTCLKLQRPAEALQSLDRAPASSAQQFDIHFQRGVALAMLNRNEEAVTCFDRAVSLDTSSPEAVNNRGAVLMRLFRAAEALQDFIQAASLRPDYADAYINAGNAHRGLAHNQQALESLNRALTLRPGDAQATWSKAIVKLSMGEMREGWPLYEARLALEHSLMAQRVFESTRWDGSQPIAGRALLIHADQGLGDTLQFCRYLRLLEARDANVIFEVQPQLLTLLSSLQMRGALVARGGPLPSFELHCPLGSLPLAFGTELDSIPGDVPYLCAPQAQRALWQRRLAELPGLKVGINWQGNPAAERLSALQERSFALSVLAPLSQVPGVTLVSLQKGSGSEQLAQVDFGDRIAQLTDPNYLGADELANETAALLCGLDLLITADTALAHLAGALGVNVWVMLQRVPDWRWLIDRDDSPWYPTMRLYRQRLARDWGSVVERVAVDLRDLANASERAASNK